MDNTIIVVNKEPYSVWEADLRKRNIEFLQSVSGDYFRYLVKTHFENADNADDKWAAVALRIGYFHGLETLFSLIGAFLQAPECAYGWIAKCSTVELRSLVSRIDRQESEIFKKLKINTVSWETINEVVFCAYEPGTEKNTVIRKQFANLWRRLAHEFLDPHNIEEYNSLKHGFRIKPGGFGLSFGTEHTPGVPAQQEEMKTLGYSKYGSSFYLLEKIGTHAKKTRSLKSKRVFINWEIEKVILLIELVAWSIDNLSSAFCILNGQDPTKVQFVRPADDDYFEKPWTYSSGVNHMSFNFTLDETKYKLSSREDLFRILDEYKSKELSDERKTAE